LLRNRLPGNGRDLVFASSDNGYAVLAHQPANASVAYIQSNLLQLFGHAWATIAAQAETGLFLPSHRNCVSAAGQWICANVTKSDRCRWLAGRVRQARNPRVLTPTTWHKRLVGKLSRCSSPLIDPADQLPGSG